MTSEIRGTSLRALLWAAAIMYPFGVLGSVMADWGEFHILAAPVQDLVVTDALAFAFLTYLAWMGVGSQAYGVTPTDEGVAVRYRSVLVLFRPPSRPKLIKWGELRDPTIKMGSVTIKTDNPWTWLELNYQQARAILTDPRCPLHSIVPKSVAQRVGIRDPVHRGSS